MENYIIPGLLKIFGSAENIRNTDYPHYEITLLNPEADRRFKKYLAELEEVRKSNMEVEKRSIPSKIKDRLRHYLRS